MAKTRKQQLIAEATIAATADNKTILYIQEQSNEATVEYCQQSKGENKHVPKTQILSKEEPSVLLNIFEDELQFRIITIFDVETGNEYYIDVVITAWLYPKIQIIKDVENLFYRSMNGTLSDVTNYGEAFCKEQAYHNIPGENSNRIETTTFVRFFKDTPARIVERSMKQMKRLLKCLDIIGDNVVLLIPNNLNESIRIAEEEKKSKAVTLTNGYAYVR